MSSSSHRIYHRNLFAMLRWYGRPSDQHPTTRHILRYAFLRLVELLIHSLISHILGMHRVETPNYAAEAHRFITLSHACLTLDSAISNTNVTAIDAMLLHVAYLVTAPVPHGHSRAEATLGMIVRLAQSVGTSYSMKANLTRHSDRTSVRLQM
jgi:hypothetical protein